MARTRQAPSSASVAVATGKWMSVDEVSAMMDVEPVFVRRWCIGGQIPGSVKQDGTWKVSRRGLSFFCNRRFENHYSPQSAALLLDVSESQVRALLADGTLKAYKVGSRAKTASIRIPESALLEVIRR
jgi:excisionase family DNA binding protein